MGQIGSLFEDVLNQAQFYNSTGSPEMDIRKFKLRECKVLFNRTIFEEGLSETFTADSGGDIGNLAPIPFLRVFDPKHSPSATSGYYVVYLFAADGSSVFACLGSAIYGRFGCPGVQVGVSEYQQQRILVNNYVSALKTALNNYGYFP